MERDRVIKEQYGLPARIPDGYISGHANHPRITTFPLADGKKSITTKEIDKIFNPEVETVYAYDVIDVARSSWLVQGRG